MITGFKPGTLYKLSPKHHLYWSELRNPSQCTPADLIFLCTEKVNHPFAEATGNRVHLLIDADTGGVWASDPKKHNYEEYLQ